MKRYWKDSEGNKAEIVLFCEMEQGENPLLAEEKIGKRDDNFPLYSPNEVVNLIKQAKGSQTAQLKRKSAIREILSQLTPKQRKVIEMRFWGKMSNKKIADKLGISEEAVHYRLEGALKKLKRYLA